MRNNQSNPSVRNILALIFNNNYLFYEAKRTIQQYFSFNGHIFFYSAKTKIRDRCDRTNEVTTWGWYDKAGPWIKNNREEVTEDSWIIIDISSNSSNQLYLVCIFSDTIQCWRGIWISKDRICVVSVIRNGFQINPIERLFRGDAIKEEFQIRGAGHIIKERIISSSGRLIHWCGISLTSWRTINRVKIIIKAVVEPRKGHHQKKLLKFGNRWHQIWTDKSDSIQKLTTQGADQCPR